MSLVKPTQEIKLIIFDWDGTLCDSLLSTIRYYQHAAKKTLKCTLQEEEVKKVVGLKFELATKMIFPSLPDEEVLQLKKEFEFIASNDENGKPALFTGTFETVSYLANQGFQLAISTNRGRISLERELKDTGLNVFFKIYKCADESCAKPHPNMIFDITKKLNVINNHVLFVGDSENDMRLAQNTSTKMLAITHGKDLKVSPAYSSIIGSISCVSELPQWLAKNTST